MRFGPLASLNMDPKRAKILGPKEKYLRSLGMKPLPHNVDYPLKQLIQSRICWLALLLG